MRPILVSACLLGLQTRYDGSSKLNRKVVDYLAANDLLPVPVCPEQLAGLPTPRPKTCFDHGDGEAVLDGTGKVSDSEGRVMNQIFLKGAIETARVARITGCKEALLKERSPSCGVHRIYLGDDIVDGPGVTAALLLRNGIRIFCEDDI